MDGILERTDNEIMRYVVAIYFVFYHLFWHICVNRLFLHHHCLNSLSLFDFFTFLIKGDSKILQEFCIIFFLQILLLYCFKGLRYLKLCLFPAPDRQLENVSTGNIIGVIWRHLFFYFDYRKSWHWKFLILFQNLHSELVYTVLYDQNLLLRNQICVIWTLKLHCCKCRKKIPIPTDPLEKWSAGNKYIFKGGLIKIFKTCNCLNDNFEKRVTLHSIFSRTPTCSYFITPGKHIHMIEDAYGNNIFWK